MTLDNISIGCVVFLDPETLRANDIFCEIRGVHPFVCISIMDGEALWVALSSKPKMGWRHRIPVPPAHLRGTKRWVTTPCFIYHQSDRWVIPHWLIQAASMHRGWQPEQLNFITPDGVALVQDSIWPIAG